MSNTKTKILFIVSEFWQAGGERQAYEFNSTIDKNLFDVHLLCFLPLRFDENKEDYYYTKHIELGSTIFFFDGFKLNNPKFGRFKSDKKLTEEKHNFIVSNLDSFFSNYSFYLFFGEYTFGSLRGYLSSFIFKRSIILIHNSIFQVPLNYMRYDKEQHLHFLSGFLDDEIKHELAEFKSFEHTYIPLSIDCSKKVPTRISKNTASTKRKIGIFTRLTQHKPLDLFYYALHLLIATGLEVELLVFGGGEPSDMAFNQCISFLGINNHVQFMGHQTDIQVAAVEHEIDLVWFHSYYGVPGGYASFDISISEIPQVFWDFTPGQQKKEYPAFDSFNNLQEFVDFSENILKSESTIQLIGSKQKKAILENRNLLNHIKKIEKLIETKIDGRQSEI